jgi:hypothetical protein
MNPISASRAGWMLALALAGAPSSLPAQEPPPTQVAPANAESFDAEFDQALSFTRRRMWKSAHAAWLELLRRHAGAVYVRPRLPEIRELVRKCAFWQVTREPEAKTCISGKLISYDATSGRICVQYSPDHLDDFAKNGELLVHPMHFSGSYTIELEGEPEPLSRMTLLVGIEGDRSCLVRVGIRTQDGRLHKAHQLFALQGDEVEALAEGEVEERTSKKPTTVQVSVRPRVVSFRYDGKQAMSAEWDSGAQGRLGISTGQDFTKLVVTGIVDPGWIDGLIDARVQQERTAFEAKWVVPEEFAAWPEAKPSETREEAIRRLFSDVTVLEKGTPFQSELIQRILEGRASGSSAAMVTVLLELNDEQLPQSARDLLLALCYGDLKRPAQVVDRLESRAKLVPPDFATQFLHAEFLTQVERREDACAILEQLARQDREPQLVNEMLAELLLIAGRHDEARAVIERGVELVGPTSEFEALRVRLAKATVGPPWRTTMSQASPHFLVNTDVDTATAKLACRTLEDVWMDCQRLLGRLDRPATPTRVFVFSGRSSYDDYIRGIAQDGLENTVGIYSRSVHQIVAWNQLSRAELVLALRHECVHRYLDLALGDVPRWYDEGLAEYISACKSSDGAWRDDALNAGRLEELRHMTVLVDLRSFFRLNDYGFMRNANSNYAQAWAVVHFLRCGRNEAAMAFERRLLAELRQRTDNSSALERALEGIDVVALQQAFITYLEKLVKSR